MPDFVAHPHIRAKIRKLRFELNMLKIKKRLFGKLSEGDEKRFRELMLELSKKYYGS